MKKIGLDDFLRLRKLVHRNARALDYTMWNYLFENNSAEDFLKVLSSYQNEDGGFGHNLECNNWNPNSSPYTICIALDYFDVVKDSKSKTKDSIVSGIIKYLESGEYLLEDGWVGMQGVPSNNDYAHMPWFHFVPEMADKPDIGVTKRLSDFILKYADSSSCIYAKAKKLKVKYEGCEKFLISGYPDYDPVELNIKAYDIATWPGWLPLPVYFIGSPESSYYAGCEHTVEVNLDSIVDSLRVANENKFTSEEDLAMFEKNNPHPDGKKWCVGEQTVGNYYWGSHTIVGDLYLLSKFGRLDFSLPAF